MARIKNPIKSFVGFLGNDELKKITAETSTKNLFKKSLRDGIGFAVLLVAINLIFISKIDFMKLSLVQQITLIVTSYIVALFIMTVVGFSLNAAERAYHQKKATKYRA
jgi:hypothetical protein